MDDLRGSPIGKWPTTRRLLASYLMLLWWSTSLNMEVQWFKCHDIGSIAITMSNEDVNPYTGPIGSWIYVPIAIGSIVLVRYYLTINRQDDPHGPHWRCTPKRLSPGRRWMLTDLWTPVTILIMSLPRTAKLVPLALDIQAAYSYVSYLTSSHIYLQYVACSESFIGINEQKSSFSVICWDMLANGSIGLAVRNTSTAHQFLLLTSCCVHAARFAWATSRPSKSWGKSKVNNPL